MIELSFRSWSLVVFAEVYVFIVSPNLYIEVRHELVNFIVTFAEAIYGRIAQIKIQVDSGIDLIKPIIIIIEHRVICPIWTYNSKISPRIEKCNSCIIIAKIRLVAPFDRHPSP